MADLSRRENLGPSRSLGLCQLPPPRKPKVCDAYFPENAQICSAHWKVGTGLSPKAYVGVSDHFNLKTNLTKINTHAHELMRRDSQDLCGRLEVI